MVTGYKVLLRIDNNEAFDWPTGATTPLVGDVVSGQAGHQLYEAVVIKRHWNFDPSDANTAVLVIHAETPQPPQRGQSSVEPLRI